MTQARDSTVLSGTAQEGTVGRGGRPQVQGHEGGFTLEIVDVWTQVQGLGKGVIMEYVDLD